MKPLLCWGPHCNKPAVAGGIFCTEHEVPEPAEITAARNIRVRAAFGLKPERSES